MSGQKLFTVGRFRAAIGHFFLGRAVQAVANFIFVLWVVRLLPLAEYGAYVTIVGLIELLVPFTSFGLFETARRFIPQTAHSRVVLLPLLRKLLCWRFAITLLTSVGVGACWKWIGSWIGLNGDHVAATGFVSSVIFLVLNFRYLAEILEALLEQKKAQLARAVLPIGKLIAVPFLIIVNKEVTLRELLLVEGLMTAICLTIVGCGLAKTLGDLDPGQEDSPVSLPIWAFARHMTAVGWANATLSTGSLRILVASSLGLNEVALYGFLQSLQLMIQRYLPTELLQGLVRPLLISRYTNQSNSDLLNQGGNLLWKSNLIAVYMLMIIIVLAGDSIIDLASGGRFLEAGPLALMLLVLLMFGASRAIFEMIMQITGYTRQLQNASMLVPLVLLLAWAVSSRGLAAIIAAHIVGLASWNMLTLYLLRRQNFPFRFDWRGGGRLIMATVFSSMTGLVVFNWLGSKYELPVVALSLALFAGLLAIFKPLHSIEYDLIRKAIGEGPSRCFRIFVREREVV